MLRLLLVIVSVTWSCTTAHHDQLLGLHEGDVCKQDKENGTLWTCKHIIQCPHALENIRRRGNPETSICSYLGSVPIVCCNPGKKTRSILGAIANAKCLEYAESVFDKAEDPILDAVFHKVDKCASALEPLVTGGKNATPKEYPHMALVGFESRKKIEWKCGGTLVNERFVLSAAQCSSDSGHPAKWIRLGEYNIASDQDDKEGYARPKDYEIIDIINHPEYKPPSLYYDITLFKLNTTVVFDEFIRPICLVNRHLFPNSPAILTGWGQTNQAGGRRKDVLQQANVALIPRKNCSEQYKHLNLGMIMNGIDDKTQLCAKDTRTGSNTCGVDLGGPIQLRLKKPYCMYALIGVTSFGKVSGGDLPNIYTRVSPFVPWIESVVWPSKADP